MKDLEIKKIYQKKIREIEKYDKQYYDKNNSLISDSEYDSFVQYLSNRK